jgi:hypothetical protein
MDRPAAHLRSTLPAPAHSYWPAISAQVSLLSAWTAATPFASGQTSCLLPSSVQVRHASEHPIDCEHRCDVRNRADFGFGWRAGEITVFRATVSFIGSMLIFDARFC